MGVGCPCPPVHNNIVTPRLLLKIDFAFHSSVIVSSHRFDGFWVAVPYFRHVFHLKRFLSDPIIQQRPLKFSVAKKEEFDFVVNDDVFLVHESPHNPSLSLDELKSGVGESVRVKEPSIEEIHSVFGGFSGHYARRGVREDRVDRMRITMVREDCFFSIFEKIS